MGWAEEETQALSATDRARCDEQLRSIVRSENDTLVRRVNRLARLAKAEIAEIWAYTEIFEAKLDKWLGLRIKGESAAIDALVELAKTTIEDEVPLYYRLRLEGEHVYVDRDLIVLPLPSLPESSPFDEVGGGDSANTKHLSPSQLDWLGSQCRSYCPGSAYMTRQDMGRLLQRAVAMPYRSGPLPAVPSTWSAMPTDKIAALVAAFDPADTHTVDWREFAVGVSLPEGVSVPMFEQLVKMRDAYLADAKEDGLVSLEAFMRVPFWFEDAGSTDVVVAAVKKGYFNLFAEQVAAAPAAVDALALVDVEQLDSVGPTSDGEAVVSARETASGTGTAAASPAMQNKKFLAPPVSGGVSGGSARTSVGISGDMASENAMLSEDDLSQAVEAGPTVLTVPMLDFHRMLVYFCFDDENEGGQNKAKGLLGMSSAAVASGLTSFVEQRDPRHYQTKDLSMLMQ